MVRALRRCTQARGAPLPLCSDLREGMGAPLGPGLLHGDGRSAWEASSYVQACSSHLQKASTWRGRCHWQGHCVRAEPGLVGAN